MKNFIIAFICILFVGVGLSASATTIDTAPDIVCVVDISPDVADATFTSVADFPAFDLASVICTPVTPDATFCIVLLPDCNDPVPLDTSPDEPDALSDLNDTTEPAPTSVPLDDPDDPVINDPCVTNGTATNTDPTDGESAECIPINGANAYHLTTTATDPADPVPTGAKSCGS